MKLNSSFVNNVIKNPRVLAPTLFIAVGTGKTIWDYQEAPRHRKKRTIVKNTAILLGSLLGFVAINPLTAKLCKKNFCHTDVGKFVEFVFKQTFAATANTFAGVVTAVYANEYMQKYVLNKPFLNPQNDASKLNFAKPPDNTFMGFIKVPENKTAKTVNRVFSNVSDLPSMRVFSSPMIALTGLSVANTKGYHNKLKKTISELLANTLIPTMFVSTTALLVDNKKPIIKYPLIFLSLILGSVAGAVISHKSKDYIGNKVDALDLKYVVVKK